MLSQGIRSFVFATFALSCRNRFFSDIIKTFSECLNPLS